MEDKSALLHQLRIDRGGEPARSDKGTRWLIAALGVLIAAGIAIWWWMRPTAIPVHVVTVQALGALGGSASASMSILDATGYVVARRQAAVASKITGKMVELDIEEGDRVKTGQTIARLDDTNIRASLNAARAQVDFANAGLAETQVNLTNAQRDYDRQKALLQGRFVSQSVVDNAQTAVDALRAQLDTQRSNVEVAKRNVDLAERNLDDTIVRSPFSGVVIAKSAQVGEIVSPLSAGGGFTRTGIGTIVDMDSLEVEVDVNEAYINRVQPGQPVESVLNAYPDWKIPSHVIAIIPTADRAKATVKVRVGLDLKDGRIVPDMGVRVSFLEDKKPAAPEQPQRHSALVPGKAVRTDSGDSVVFVVTGQKARRRAVTLGGTVGDSREVLSGVSAGETVIVDAPAELKDDASVTVIKP
ncbi:MAG TPA: efflux RND transporter periplasmic adaptor subunit [Steroidobacteraceae bacterium]|jgi:RND family efflux transporter MFP subunit|nr:efflux RND transporter periplasmic adaptor subunit [Steroidobacteraceae bacterium]